MILAMMDTDGTAGIVLTNGIIPPANVLAKARSEDVPLMVVPGDTYTTALQIEKIRPLLRAEDDVQIDAVAALAAEYLDLEAIRNLL
jgi:BioD-like phosphotransacetylase family protein